MKQNLLALLFSALIYSSCPAADAPPTIHWYTVTLAEGNSSKELTGSSGSDANQLAEYIVSGNFITLENLRIFGSRDGTSYKWSSEASGKVFITARAILYFRELAADPAAQETQQPAVSTNKEKQIVINVTHEGTFLLANAIYNLAGLSTKLKELSTLEPKPEVVIRTVKGTDYKHVTDVLDACKTAGIDQVAFATAEKAPE